MTRRQRNLAVTAPVEDEPLPPSHARRWTIGILVLIALLIGTRLWWGWVADRRLQAAIADLRSRGEPVTDADFAEPPLPDEQNAAFYLRRAAAGIHPVLRDNSALVEAAAHHWYERPLSPDAEQSLRCRLQRTQPILAEVRRARSAAGTQWSLANPTDADGYRALLDLYGDLRGLGDELTYASREAHSTGDDGSAVEYILDGLFLEHAFGRARDVVSYVLAGGAGTVVIDEASQLAPELRIGDSPPLASRGQVHELIRELLDTDAPRERLVRALQSDRKGASRTGSEFAWYTYNPTAGDQGLVRSPGWVNRPATVLFRPYAVLHSATILRHSIASVEAARQADSTAFTTFTIHSPPPQTGLPVVDTVAGLFRESDAARIIGIHRQCAALHARVARDLAIRLFELDHGRKPSSVKELVPNYLPLLTRYVSPLAPPATTAPATAPLTCPTTLPAP
jgi:hypothetical protein